VFYTTTTKLGETKTYAVRDRNPQGRAVLSGHPVKDQFQLVGTTKLVQAARDAYRFEPKVPAGKAAKQTVTEEGGRARHPTQVCRDRSAQPTHPLAATGHRFHIVAALVGGPQRGGR
jgi:hypothetical protein